MGIDNAADIVGFYMPTTLTSIGFLDMGGVITTIDPCGSTFTLDLFLVFRRPLGGVGRAILPAACFQQALVGNEEAD